jgi:adenylate cyclase
VARFEIAIRQMPRETPRGAVPAAAIEAAFARIAASPAFQRSARHLRFLRFLIDGVVAGGVPRLKEIVLAVEVFGREAATFDPQVDPVVRVEARRLRSRLIRYYRNDGADDPVEISLRAGSYVPTISWRERDTKDAQPSIVVLPFADFTSDRSRDSLCDSLTDEVTDALTRVSGLKIVARTSAYQFKDKACDVREIGQLLGVSHVLEGSLQRHENRYRITVQLNRVTDGCHLWSDVLESAADGDLFDVQESIARRIVDILQLHLGDDERADSTSGPLVRRGESSAEGRDLYYRARYLSRQRSLAGYLKAAELLHRAIRRDPDFAVAHAALGSVLTNYAGFCPMPAAETMAEAKRSAMRALDIDAELGEAHAVLATIVYRYEFDWITAEKHYLRALRLSPSAPYPHSSYASGLLFHGRFEEAMHERALAQALDPLDFSLRPLQALLYLQLRKYALAEAEFLVALEIDPVNLFSVVLLGMTYVCWGKAELARARFREAAKLAPTLPIGLLGGAMVDALMGRREKAHKQMSKVLTKFQRDYLPPYQVAMAYAQLDDVEAAIEWLERAADVRDFNFVGLPLDPTFDKVEHDPRFGALLARHKLQRMAPPALAELS